MEYLRNMEKEQKQRLSDNLKQFKKDRRERKDKRTFIIGPEYTFADLKKVFEAGWTANYCAREEAFAPENVDDAFDKYMQYDFKKR